MVRASPEVPKTLSKLEERLDQVRLSDYGAQQKTADLIVARLIDRILYSLKHVCLVYFLEVHQWNDWSKEKEDLDFCKRLETVREDICDVYNSHADELHGDFEHGDGKWKQALDCHSQTC